MLRTSAQVCLSLDAWVFTIEHECAGSCVHGVDAEAHHAFDPDQPYVSSMDVAADLQRMAVLS